MQHTRLHKCGGVLHHGCSAHLDWLMFARCAVQVEQWKNPTPSNGHSGHHKRKLMDFYCSQQQLYDGKMSWSQPWESDRSLWLVHLRLQLDFCLVLTSHIFSESLFLPRPMQRRFKWMPRLSDLCETRTVFIYWHPVLLTVPNAH